MNTVENLLSEIPSATGHGNWYAALALALTIPDICASLEASDGKANGTKYAAWFDQYVQPRYMIQSKTADAVAFMTGNDCYALRCSFLHNGSFDISEQRKKETVSHFVFITGGSHKCKYNNVLGLNVSNFAQDLCRGGYNWLEAMKLNQLVQERLGNLLTIEIEQSFGDATFR